MRFLSLRLIISTLTTVAILSVAAVTLTLVSTSSLAAVSSLADKYLVSLANSADALLANDINRMTAAAVQLAQLTTLRDYPHPSDDTTVYNGLTTLTWRLFWRISVSCRTL
jgi:hypothetical protein